jgi:hypothetical protein
MALVPSGDGQRVDRDGRLGIDLQRCRVSDLAITCSGDFYAPTKTIPSPRFWMFGYISAYLVAIHY